MSTRRRTTAAIAATMLMTGLGAVVPAQAAGAGAGTSAATVGHRRHVPCWRLAPGPERRHCWLYTSKAYQSKLLGPKVK